MAGRTARSDESDADLTYSPLGALVPWEDNPKDHDLGSIIHSINEHGFNDPIGIRNGCEIVEGHGRVDALLYLQAHGSPMPRGYVREGPDGEWMVATIALDHLSDAGARAYAIAHNRSTERGGWHDEKLAAVLTEIAEESERLLEATLYDREDLTNLLASLEAEAVAADQYSRKIEAPIYEPRNERPNVADLYDDSRTRLLTEEIKAADHLTDEEREFLTVAARRHTVLRFDLIADFYALADPRTQALMESNALVIIDFDQAIEAGFVRFSKQVAELVGEEDEYDE